MIYLNKTYPYISIICIHYSKLSHRCVCPKKEWCEILSLDNITPYCGKSHDTVLFPLSTILCAPIVLR